MMLRAARIVEAIVNPDRSVTIALEQEDNGIVEWLMVVDLPPARAKAFAKAVVDTVVWGGNGHLLIATPEGDKLWAEPVDKGVIRMVERYRRDHWSWEMVNQ